MFSQPSPISNSRTIGFNFEYCFRPLFIFSLTLASDSQMVLCLLAVLDTSLGCDCLFCEDSRSLLSLRFLRPLSTILQISYLSLNAHFSVPSLPPHCPDL